MTIKGLEAKIVAKNSKIAEIEIEGQKIKIPKEYLPANIEVGKVVHLHFMNCENSTSQEKKLAKEILNEILNGK